MVYNLDAKPYIKKKQIKPEATHSKANRALHEIAQLRDRLDFMDIQIRELFERVSQKEKP